MNTAQALEPLRERICTAVAAGTPLRLRGGGSKDFYGQSLQGEVLDTTALNGVVSYEPSELVITALAGTPLATVEALLASAGQYLPFEPPHFSGSNPTAPSSATLGGMVASGLSGPARASAGSVRDHVLGVSLLNGRAESLSFGGQVIKNVAGYDVSRLMVGAMGTLGLLTSVSLKVLPLPPAEATLVFELGQDAALAQLHRWGAQPLPLNASCWVKDDSNPEQRTRELLFVRLRGAIAAVEAACAKMLCDVPPAAHAHRMDSTQAATDWRLCRDHQLPFFTHPPAPGMALWRLSVAQTAPVLDVPWPQLIEWHGGLRWLWAPLSAGTALREVAKQAGGHATVFVANCSLLTGATEQFDTDLSVNSPLPAPLDRIHRQLKAEFDPAGVFNRGRLYDCF
jgi:glycolate oxidase FAD binding subunit